MEFPLDPIERFDFGDSNADADLLDPWYIVWLQDEGALSVIAAITEPIGWDKADCVGPAKRQQSMCSDAESTGEVGEKPRSMAFIHSEGGINGKRKAGLDDGPADSAQSSLNVNPEAPGWTKRARVAANAAERTPCANRIGALEKSIRSYAETRGEHVVEPAMGMTFNSLGEAYDFYNLYSREHGFGIRYGKSRLNPERTKTMQDIVCGCSGKPVKENTRSCRCECPVMIRLPRTQDNEHGTRNLTTSCSVDPQTSHLSKNGTDGMGPCTVQKGNIPVNTRQNTSGNRESRGEEMVQII